MLQKLIFTMNILSFLVVFILETFLILNFKEPRIITKSQYYDHNIEVNPHCTVVKNSFDKLFEENLILNDIVYKGTIVLKKVLLILLLILFLNILQSIKTIRIIR